MQLNWKGRKYKTIKGNIKKGFEEADLIVKNELTLPAVAHVPMETHASIAQVINIKIVEVQIMVGVLQGIGSAIIEGYKFSSEGRLMNPSFTDNKIPTAKDIPIEITPILIENPQPDGPFGARGAMVLIR